LRLPFFFYLSEIIIHKKYFFKCGTKVMKKS